MSELSIENPTALPQSPGGRIIRREDAQSWIEGYRFLEQARHAADSLRRDAQSAYEQEKKRGFEQGRSAGTTEAAAIIADASSKVDHYLASIEPQVAELSLSIVERILGKLDDAEAVALATRQALASFRREKHLKIRVSPQVLEEVRQALATWSGAEVSVPALSVEADARLAPRQCTIVTEFAVIDAGLDAQLDIIRRTLKVGGTSEPRLSERTP